MPVLPGREPRRGPWTTAGGAYPSQPDPIAGGATEATAHCLGPATRGRSVGRRRPHRGFDARVGVRYG